MFSAYQNFLRTLSQRARLEAPSSLRVAAQRGNPSRVQTEPPASAVAAPPVKLMQLRAALRDDQETTNRFFMAREGMIPSEAFFNPENLQRIMTEAQAKM